MMSFILFQARGHLRMEEDREGETKDKEEGTETKLMEEEGG